MERRDFVGCASLASLSALAGTAAAQEAGQKSVPPAKGVRITVLKTSVQAEFQKYREREITPCSQLKEGQEFLVEVPWYQPEGFCAWAWADIRTYIHIVHAGARDRFVACCTDGFRPVFFKLERVV